MCELLGMSANVPTDICFSFAGLMERGGGTGPHNDGWGIAFYDGKAVREFRDPTPSYRSEIARLISQYPIKSCITISHIRQANVGGVCLENTHPFVRELWGRQWAFAHNGQMRRARDLPLGYEQPVGTTDSEHAFCWLLQRIRQDYPVPPGAEAQAAFWAFLKTQCDQLRELGVCNLLFSDAEYLYVYCTTKLQRITRRSPFGHAELKDTTLQVDFDQHTTPSDIVCVIATEPLTANECWTPLQSGEFLVYRYGQVVAQLTDTEQRFTAAQIAQ